MALLQFVYRALTLWPLGVFLLLIFLDYVIVRCARLWIWEKRISWADWAMAITLLGAINFSIGLQYAWFGGSRCDLISGNGEKESITYLRTIGDGHLFRRNGNTAFKSKDAVKELECQRPDSKAARIWGLS